MTQIISAIYENGVLRPLTPLDLPDHEVVQLVVAPLPAIEASSPSVPGRMSSEEFRRRLKELVTYDGALPDDFSRADIYADHD